MNIKADVVKIILFDEVMRDMRAIGILWPISVSMNGAIPTAKIMSE